MDSIRADWGVKRSLYCGVKYSMMVLDIVRDMAKCILAILVSKAGPARAGTVTATRTWNRQCHVPTVFDSPKFLYGSDALCGRLHCYLLIRFPGYATQSILWVALFSNVGHTWEPLGMCSRHDLMGFLSGQVWSACASLWYCTLSSVSPYLMTVHWRWIVYLTMDTMPEYTSLSLALTLLLRIPGCDWRMNAGDSGKQMPVLWDSSTAIGSNWPWNAGRVPNGQSSSVCPLPVHCTDHLQHLPAARPVGRTRVELAEEDSAVLQACRLEGFIGGGSLCVSVLDEHSLIIDNLGRS